MATPAELRTNSSLFFLQPSYLLILTLTHELNRVDVFVAQRCAKYWLILASLQTGGLQMEAPESGFDIRIKGTDNIYVMINMDSNDESSGVIR